MPHIIFICTGNICRSPIAEGLLRTHFLNISKSGIRVTSMGTRGLPSWPAAPESVQVCKERGIDLSTHRSRPLIPEELHEADFIFTMDLQQRDFIRGIFPKLSNRTFLLGSWPGKENHKGEVEDPYGGTEKDFRIAYAVIERHIKKIAPLIISELEKKTPGSST
jgi:protein-tyrosine-phosphatase